jgi:hypothetical protein
LPGVHCVSRHRFLQGLMGVDVCPRARAKSSLCYRSGPQPIDPESRMNISMYQASVPTFIHVLRNLAAILEKAAAHAEAKKIAPEVLLASRLFPDMFPLSQQVQIAADSAKGGAARLAQLEPPSFADDETTFAQLVERCHKTIAFLETLEPGQIDGAEERTITWKTRQSSRSMPGMAYLLRHVMPNLFFHTTTAYAILRHNGVELGKADFLGNR